jgi:integrase
VLIADVLNAYLSEHAPQTKSQEFLVHTARPILQWWDVKTLAEIKGSTCREYVKWRRAQGVSQWTARHDLATLAAAVRFYAREYGPLSMVPVVTLPKKPRPRDRWLTRDEAAALLRAARARSETRHVARFILIGIYSGTRSRAILGLRWTPSAEGGWLDLEREVLYRQGREEEESRKRRPPARIHRRLLAHLRRWRRLDREQAIDRVVHYQGRGIEKLRRSWESVCARAGVGEDVVPHTCRHTAATWQMQAGTDHFEAAGYLGMSIEMLVRVYGHHHPSFQSAAAQAAPGRRRSRADKA